MLEVTLPKNWVTATALSRRGRYFATATGRRRAVAVGGVAFCLATVRDRRILLSLYDGPGPSRAGYTCGGFKPSLCNSIRRSIAVATIFKKKIKKIRCYYSNPTRRLRAVVV